MSYTSPSNTAVDFEFQSGYSPPTNTSVDFTFDKTSTKAKVFSTAAISQTTSAFGDLQGNTTATQGVSVTSTSPTDTVGQHPSIASALAKITGQRLIEENIFLFTAGKSLATFSVTNGRSTTNTGQLDRHVTTRFLLPAKREDESVTKALATAIVSRLQGNVFSFAAGKSVATFSIIDGRTITNTPKLDTQADTVFVMPADRTDGTKTSVSVDESQTTDLRNDPLFVADSTDSLTSTTEKRRVTLPAATAARTVPSKFETLEITDNQRAGDASFDVDFPGPSDEVDFRQRSHEVIYLDANDS